MFSLARAAIYPVMRSNSIFCCVIYFVKGTVPFALDGCVGIRKIWITNNSVLHCSRTPLHMCAGNLQNLEVLFLLVEHGARIEDNDLEGTRPVDLHLVCVAKGGKVLLSSIVYTKMSRQVKMNDVIHISLTCQCKTISDSKQCYS